MVLCCLSSNLWFEKIITLSLWLKGQFLEWFLIRALTIYFYQTLVADQDLSFQMRIAICE